MTDYSIELGEYLYRVTCSCCGTEKNRVWGFISKDGDAHAIYYALLNIEEEAPRIGLSLSIGPWWDGTDPSQRAWVHLSVWSDSSGIKMSLRDPKESNFYPWEKGGVALDRSQAKVSPIIDEIWSVADFVVAQDAAISTYLKGHHVDTAGREVRDSGNGSNRCQ